jgi:glyoxylase-like metal-dependent hydrolase (beta-lactamase superfamily II)
MRRSGIEELAPGLFRWHIADDRIGGIDSESYAVVRNGRAVLIDPHRMAVSSLRALGEIEAIILTIQSHQYASWHLREQLRVPVWAPRGAVGLKEKPDRFYGEGDELPGGLRAMHAPGPCDGSYVLFTEGPRPVAFFGDVAIRDERGRLGYPDAVYQDDPDLAPKSIARFAREVPVSIACFGHGEPMLRNTRRALEALSHRAPP